MTKVYRIKVSDAVSEGTALIKAERATEAIAEAKRKGLTVHGHYHGPHYTEGDCIGGAPGDKYPL